MKPPTVTLSQIEQTVDLKELTGVDLSEARPIKEAIAQAIIDRIQSRTEAGEGLRFSSNGSATPVKLKSPYSNQYADSIEFKAAGKRKSTVNMTLTGDMLASMDVLSTNGNSIKIGITDDTQIAKAFNHITGDTVPKRPWFGISKTELGEILSQFKPDIEKIKRSQTFTTDTESDALAVLDKLRSFGGEDD
jgi:hypothetical protein